MAGGGKLFGLAATALKSNFTSLQKPYKLNFCMTYLCQSRCMICSIWQMKPQGELTIDEIRSFTKKNNSFRWVNLTGGEPFLRSDIVEVARAFVENCKDLYVVTTPTNSLCDLKMVERKIRDILELGVPRYIMTVSLDGHRELHDKLRGIPGNFDKAMENYKMMLGIKKDYPNFDAVFGYTMSRLNLGQFEQTFQSVKKFFPDIEYTDFHINLAQTSSMYYKNGAQSVSPIGEEASMEISQMYSKRKRLLDPMHLIEDAFMRKLITFAKSGKPPMKSRGLDASLYLDSWGNVYPSIMWDKKIGNIRDVDYDLANLWHTPIAEEVRKEIMDGKEPVEWTACEAHQSLVGNLVQML